MILEKELFNLQDKKYQDFQKKLCPGCENIIGIRVPTLRKFARENKEKIDINKIKSDYYEEIMLKGMLIGIDKDEEALIVSKNRLSNYSNVKYVHGNHDEISEILEKMEISKVDRDTIGSWGFFIPNR